MVLNRVNNTDPVVQVRLRVMQGNLYGTLQKVYLAAGFVYPFALKHTLKGGTMQNQPTRKRITSPVKTQWRISYSLIVIGVIVVLTILAAMAAVAIDARMRL